MTGLYEGKDSDGADDKGPPDTGLRFRSVGSNCRLLSILGKGVFRNAEAGGENDSSSSFAPCISRKLWPVP